MDNPQVTTFSAQAPTTAPSLSAWGSETRQALSDETRRDIKAWRSASDAFRSYFRGQSISTGPLDGPLTDYLARLEKVLGHEDLNAAVREQLQHDKSISLRLLHYNASVAPRFADQYREVLSRGFTVLGLTTPDFATLNRGQANEQIDLFNTRLAQAMNAHHDRDLLPAYDVRELLTGLRHLWTRVVPDAWLPR